MKQLYSKLESLINDSTLFQELLGKECVFPFTKETRVLAYLLHNNFITFDQYDAISNEYAERNKYLLLFDMAPRTFGETWGENHILKLFPKFSKATKESLAKDYPGFDGEFDLWLNGIRVEVKACRANSQDAGKSLASRAYLHEEAVANGFKYHYQQLKPSCCDVFIWIGVCRDKLIYWVLTSDELKDTGKLGSQHRNENTGNEDTEVFEGQVFMTEKELSSFAVKEVDVLNKVIEKGTKSNPNN